MRQGVRIARAISRKRADPVAYIIRSLADAHNHSRYISFSDPRYFILPYGL